MEYIDFKLSKFETHNEHKNEDGFYPGRYYKINGVYISFEFNGLERIKKVECGRYYTENDTEYVSNAKAVLDKTKKQYVDFLQLSYDGEYGEQYELPFNAESKLALDVFLKLPIEEGWVEKRYKYKNGVYKIKVEGKGTEFEIIMLSTAEQDLPLPGDQFSRKVDSFIIDNFYRKKNISVEVSDVKPILEIIMQQTQVRNG
ncbi:MAG: hypothetical protein QM783_21200 [Phycisphaerales bacterium]